MTEIHIPPEALEAGAKELCEREEWKISWDDLEDYDREFYLDNARAACLAMLSAWPGMLHMEAHRVNNPVLILPLPQEASDE